jgi:hypothetical protein
MEIQACLEAVRAIARGRVPVDVASYRKLIFWTDSQYLGHGFVRPASAGRVTGG